MNDRQSAERTWRVIVGVLVVLTLATAVASSLVSGSLLVALGATATALAIAAVGLLAPGALAESWREHRPYVWLATGLFAAGTVVGVLLVLAGYDLLEFFLELLDEELAAGDGTGPEEGDLELSAGFFIFQNTPPFLVSIFGALTLGVLTAVVMVFNGVLVGNVVYVVGQEVGFGLVFLSVAPHGVFELPALFVAAGVGFRFLHRFVQRILGTREAFLTKPYLYRTGVLVLFAWLVLVLAAFVEAYVTLWLVDLVVPA